MPNIILFGIDRGESELIRLALNAVGWGSGRQ